MLCCDPTHLQTAVDRVVLVDWHVAILVVPSHVSSVCRIAATKSRNLCASCVSEVTMPSPSSMTCHVPDGLPVSLRAEER